MIHPFPVDDYLSSLASADWYEENNQQDIADSIRELTRPPFEMWVISYRRSWSRIMSGNRSRIMSRSWSGSKSRGGSGSRSWSRSGSRSWSN